MSFPCLIVPRPGLFRVGFHHKGVNLVSGQFSSIAFRWIEGDRDFVLAGFLNFQIPYGSGHVAPCFVNIFSVVTPTINFLVAIATLSCTKRARFFAFLQNIFAAALVVIEHRISKTQWEGVDDRQEVNLMPDHSPVKSICTVVEAVLGQIEALGVFMR